MAGFLYFFYCAMPYIQCQPGIRGRNPPASPILPNPYQPAAALLKSNKPQILDISIGYKSITAILVQILSVHFSFFFILADIEHCILCSKLCVIFHHMVNNRFIFPFQIPPPLFSRSRLTSKGFRKLLFCLHTMPPVLKDSASQK